jgi:hypothetical protein
MKRDGPVNRLPESICHMPKRRDAGQGGASSNGANRAGKFN